MIYVHKSKNISSFLFEQVENRNLIIVSVVIWIRWFAYEEFVNRIEALHSFFFILTQVQKRKLSGKTCGHFLLYWKNIKI